MAKHACVLILFLAIAAHTSAQTTAPAPTDELGPIPRGSAKSKAWNERGWATANTILEHLSADDSPAVREAEMARIKMLLRARPAFVTKNNTVPGLLLYKKMYAELIEVADYAVTCHPEATNDIAVLQKFKAKALAGLDRNAESLATAKAYYNVAPIAKTADAMQLLTETLATADAERATAFKSEQIAGAELVPADQLKAPRPRTAVLESIKIDASPYDKQLADRSPVSYIRLVAEGNLLLLADRTGEALQKFQAAQALASDREAAEATENIARAMRAADGSIGRANAWIDSLNIAK